VTGGEAGAYQLTFHLEGTELEASALITVLPGQLSLSQTSLRLALGLGFGDTAKLSATQADGLVWTSADPSVATVENGLVRAVGAGSTVVSVSAGGYTDACSVEVLDGLRGLALPAALTAVEEEAFRDDDAVQYILLPEGIREIGQTAFAEDDALLLVLLPAMTTAFGEDVFRDSAQVVVVGRAGSDAQRYCLENHIAFQCVD